jgi:hypothetical protein
MCKKNEKNCLQNIHTGVQNSKKSFQESQQLLLKKQKPKNENICRKSKQVSKKKLTKNV